MGVHVKPKSRHQIAKLMKKILNYIILACASLFRPCASFLKKTLLYIILALLLLRSTALVWHVTHMNKSDLIWMSHYQTGSCEYFISQHGNIDALMVREKDVWNTYRLFGYSIGDHDYIAGGDINYTIYHKNDTIDGYLGISKEIQSEPIFTFFNLGDLFCKNAFEYSTIFGFIPKLQYARINDFVFPDCLIADESNSEYWQGPIKYGVTGFVWSRSKGLLQYSFLGGEVFTRIEFTEFRKKAGLKIAKERN